MTTPRWPDWQVAAEVEIRALVQRYNAVGDAGRFDAFVDLFTSDAVFEVAGESRPYEGHAGLRTLLAGANDQLREWAGGDAVHLRHFTATHLIDFVARDEATGRLYYQCLMTHGLDHWGHYVDRYRKVDGTWRIAARREVRDGMVEGGWCWTLWGPAGSRRVD